MRYQRIAMTALALWLMGLVLAAHQLQTWQERLLGVLMHLEADALVHHKAWAAGRGVHANWYRDRALTLIEAVEQLHEPSPWTVMMPGSWRIFDDLEERAHQRIGRAFGQLVIETVRRAMERRAARVTGMALDPYTEALDSGPGCRAPAVPSGTRWTLDLVQVVEFEAMSAFLAEASRMDRAMASLLALRREHPGNAQALQHVIRYSLGADLSGPASRSLALFRAQPETTDPDGQALAQRLAHALRCTTWAGMTALLDRLTTDNVLLDSERAIRQAIAALERPPAAVQTGADDAALRAHLRGALARIDAQRDLLASSAPHAWLQPHGNGLVAAHGGLLAQIGKIDLLGPAVAHEIRHAIGRRQQALHQAIDRLVQGPDAGLAWDEARDQLVQSPRRIALHARLMAQLDQASRCHPHAPECRFSPPAAPRAASDTATEPAARASVAD